MTSEEKAIAFLERWEIDDDAEMREDLGLEFEKAMVESFHRNDGMVIVDDVPHLRGCPAAFWTDMYERMDLANVEPEIVAALAEAVTRCDRSCACGSTGRRSA